MSDFACSVIAVQIQEHPNADAIEIAKIGDYQSIVQKGQFQDGDLAVYIPEQAVVPEWLLKHIGLWDEKRNKGGLAGSSGNRVKAIKLRGVLSQGLTLSGDNEGNLLGIFNDDEEVRFFSEGDDVAEFLGITKYSPPIPSHMSARVLGADLAVTHKYDFDNLKKTPDLFEIGDEIVITEKIHGTLIQIAVVPDALGNEKYYKGRVVVSSKGMGAQGYVLDHDDESSVYPQAAKKHGLLDMMLEVFGDAANRNNAPIFLFGEVFGKTLSGKGIQDLIYTGEELDFRAFDICVGNRGNERYLEWDHFVMACEKLGCEHVPVLYRGDYSKEIVLLHTDGNTTIQPKVTRNYVEQIREGVVVKTVAERKHAVYGRKIAKSVSEAYLLRKGDVSEFN